MPTIKISKIKARRGTDEQRKLLIFDQGELIYTLDTKRFYIGDGVSYGGEPIGNKIFYPPLNNVYSLTGVNSQVGDISIVKNTFYQLTAQNYENISSWGRIPQVVADPVIFKFEDETLYLNPSSISSDYIDPSTVSNGLKISGGILQTNFQTKSLEISAFKLSLKESGIDEREISNTTFINGISGGNGSKIGLNVNENYFYFDSNVLTLSGACPFTVNETNILSASFINGIIGGSGDKISINANSTNFYFNSGGQLSLSGVNESNILSTTFTNGISGGNGNKIGINANSTNFYFNSGGQLSLSGVNPFQLTFDDLQPQWFGSGLSYNTTQSTISSYLTNVDYTTLARNSSGVVSLSNIGAIANRQWAYTVVDNYGRVTKTYSTISSTLTSNNSGSIFNGNPDQLINGPIATTRTILSAIDPSGAVMSLSSAGFITFDSMTSRAGSSIGRFAIPIYTY